MLIASKFDELDDNIPMVRDFQRATKFVFSYTQIISSEADLLTKVLKWDLMVLTPLHFVYSLMG